MKAEQFTPVVSRLRPRLLALAVQFDDDTAEDAVQEALMRLWTAWADLPEEEDAARLAVRLTKHACIDAYRQRRQHQRLWEKETRQTAATASADEPLRQTELQKALEQAVAVLPPSERRLWNMFSEAQMDNAEISAATGIGIRSVRTMVGHARRRILELMKKGGAL